MLEVTIGIRKPMENGRNDQFIRLTVEEMLELQRCLNILTKDCYPTELYATERKEDQNGKYSD